MPSTSCGEITVNSKSISLPNSRNRIQIAAAIAAKRKIWSDDNFRQIEVFLEQSDKVHSAERGKFVGERLDDADIDAQLAGQLESFFGCR